MTDDDGIRRSMLDKITALATDDPDAAFIGDGRTVLSRAEVLRLIKHKTALFRESGVGPGSRVASIPSQAVDLITDTFAVIGLGGVIAPLSAGVTRWELDRICAFLAPTHLSAPVDAGLVLGDSLGSAGGRLLSGSSRHAYDQHGAATAQLTSGTTGRQRAALRPAVAVAIEADAYRDRLSLSPGERIVCVLPAQHAYAFGLCGLAATLHGVPVDYVTDNKPRALLRSLSDAGGGLVPSVPPMLRLMAAAAESGRGLGAARFLTAGMPLDAGTLEAVRTRLRAPLGQVYGTTETGPICIEPPGSHAVKLGQQGEPIPGVQVRFEDGSDGSVGPRTMFVRSPMALIGYADGMQLDRTVLDSGWFRTGDLVVRNEHGLSVRGRTVNSINVAGAKVSPEEIEAAILGFAGVHSCLVHPVVDDRLGERIVAKVTPARIDVKALDRFLRERLSPVMVPHVYEPRDELAATETGKVIRPRRV